MSRVSLRGIVLLAVLLGSWLCSSANAADAASLSEVQGKNRITELQKTDEFNIRVALKRAIDADSPGELFHWHNPHTNHSGTMTTLGTIGPRGNGLTCVDLVHLYYASEASAIRHETTVCRDRTGNWNESGAQTASSASTHLQLYTEQAVYGVQSILSQLRYAPGSVDGIYGSRTRRAIEDFQQDEGLPVTGKITDTLITALNQTRAILEDPSSAPKTETPQSAATEPATMVSSPSAPKPSKPLSMGDTSGVVSPDSLSFSKPDDRIGAGSSVVVKAAATPEPRKPVLSDSGSNHTVKELRPNDTADSVDPVKKISILRERVNRVGPFDSIWLAAVAGFAVCCIAGAFAAWFVTPRVNRMATQQTDLDQAEDELNAKIALVTRRFDETSAPEAERRSAGVKVHSPPRRSTQAQGGFEEVVNASEQERGKVTVAIADKSDTAQAPIDKMAGKAHSPPPRSKQAKGELEGTINASEQEREKVTSSSADKSDTARAPVDKMAVNNVRLQERPERTAAASQKKVEHRSTKEVLTPSQDATETIKQADEFIDIIEAIKEAEELIKEAQQTLRKDPLDAAAKDYITNAIKQATELIREALSSGSIEGGSSQEITTALKTASELIKKSLQRDHIEESSHLRLT